MKFVFVLCHDLQAATLSQSMFKSSVSWPSLSFLFWHYETFYFGDLQCILMNDYTMQPTAYKFLVVNYASLLRAYCLYLQPGSLLFFWLSDLSRCYRGGKKWIIKLDYMVRCIFLARIVTKESKRILKMTQL